MAIDRTNDTKAYRQFISGATEAQYEIRTIEISNPDIGSLYFVKGFNPIYLATEVGAATFQPIAMDIEEAGENAELDQSFKVKLGGVGGEVQTKIEQLTNFITPINLIYRKYYSGDLTAPVMTLKMTVSTIDFAGYSAVTIEGEDSDFFKRRAGERYTYERFPLLKGI